MGITNQNTNQNRNGNVVAARPEGNGNGNNGNQIRCHNCKGLGHYARNCTDAASDIDEIYEVNTNCILMANLQQASTSGTQTDKAPYYDSDGSAEAHHYENCYDIEIFNMFTQEERYTELLESITEPHPVQQNTSNVIFAEPSVEHNGGTVEKQHVTIEETRTYFESLYNNLVTEVEKVNRAENGNGNVVAARPEGNGNGNNGTQTDKASYYDSDGLAEAHHYENCYDIEIFNMFTQEEQYTELLESITEPHPVQQNT
nr:hypothetical protein [Tanacetum cinerariifolium]